MPLTFAHPVAVLPLLGTPLPFSALAVGAMIPDFPLFVGGLLPAGMTYATTHTPLAVLTLDVALGLAAWALWRVVLRAPLVDAAPAAIRSRVPRPTRPRGARLSFVPLAIAVGAGTHVLWDEFTHPGRWGTRNIEWLATTHAGLSGASWAQYASGVGGLLVLAVAGVLALRRATPTPRPRRRPHLAPWVVRVPVAAALAVASLLAGVRPSSLHEFAFEAVTLGAAAAGAGLLAAAVLWHVAPGRRREGVPGAPERSEAASDGVGSRWARADASERMRS